ncbi:(2Fe-2S) ferredoxin domain-containing protein [Pleurocapsales cyanobacterium LEGE 10410]|nr:(2Fe-2S) ferredoxin domain-containing protein [Pleurocapsales cyanobacterium LEGE 10410]
MVAIQPLVAEFNIVGRLEDLTIGSKGRIKYLSLSTPETDYLISVAKSPQNLLGEHLKPGCHLKVTGMRKYKLHQAEVEYKAYKIELLLEQSATKTAIAKKAPVKILVCQGSSCAKRGSQTICKLLQTELNTKGIASEVEIKSTGCMKQCKQAPCLIMPGRNSYSRVQPQQVSKLVSKHC